MISQKAQRDYVENIMDNCDREDFHNFRFFSCITSGVATAACLAGVIYWASPVAALGAGLLSGLYYMDRNFSDIIPDRDRGYLTNHSALRFEYARWVMERDEEMASLELDSIAGFANGVMSSPPVAAFRIAAALCVRGAQFALGYAKGFHSIVDGVHLCLCNDQEGETNFGSFLKRSAAFLDRSEASLNKIDLDSITPTSFRSNAAMDRVVALSLAKRAALA